MVKLGERLLIRYGVYRVKVERMPNKDPEKLKEYHKKYYQEHKKEHDKTMRKWIINHPNFHKEYEKDNLKNAKDFLFLKLGRKCVICGKSNHRIVFHEIHGKPHKTLTYNQTKKLWENFLPLCYNCHQALHLYMLYKEKFEKLSMAIIGKLLLVGKNSIGSDLK